jgi:large subunit ribosomal protein L9
MKVILQKDVPNLGDAGDIKEVANGFARNYLIPNKLVIVANESSKKAIDHQAKLIKIKKEKRRKTSEQIVSSLSDIELVMPVKVGEEGKLFGSITSMDIAKQLKAKGFEVDKRKILLDAPIKHVGEFKISIKLEESLTAAIKVSVVPE